MSHYSSNASITKLLYKMIVPKFIFPQYIRAYISLHPQQHLIVSDVKTCCHSDSLKWYILSLIYIF